MQLRRVLPLNTERGREQREGRRGKAICLAVCIAGLYLYNDIRRREMCLHSHSWAFSSLTWVQYSST